MNSTAQITGPIRRYRLIDYSKSQPQILKECWMCEAEQIQTQRQIGSTYQVWEVDPDTPAHWSVEQLVAGVFGFWQSTSIVEFEEVRGGDPAYPDEAAYLEFVRLAELLGNCSAAQLDGILEAYRCLLCYQDDPLLQPVEIPLQSEQTAVAVPRYPEQIGALVSGTGS